MAESSEKGAGSKPPRPAAKKAAEPKAEAPKPIGIEPVIRVGGHVIRDGVWTPEEDS